MTLVVISLFTSCAMHNGYMVNSASLSSSNFKYVNKEVTGTAIASYVIGIGGISKATLVGLAKQNLIEYYPLKENQALANITINWKTTYVLPFAITNRCTITADIVEFK